MTATTYCRSLRGRSRTSRNYLNLPATLSALNASVAQHGLGSLVQVEAHDLAVLSFEDQVRLIGESGVIVGMHGAGIASSMHMAIGSRLCCGLIEIYPSGEFSPILGHGNMARKMGLRYDRVDIAADQSKHDGAFVPTVELSNKVLAMIRSIQKAPTCVVADVRNDPYLIK